MSKIVCIITNEAAFTGIVNTAKQLGEVTAIVIGSQDLANDVAKSGISSVKFIEATLAETKTNIVTNTVNELAPKFILTNSAAGARVLAGAVAKKLDAVLIPGVVKAKLEDDAVVVEQEGLSGRVIETLTSTKPVIGFFAGEDVELSENSPVEINNIEGEGFDINVEVASSGATSGLNDATHVVSIGRGVKSKDDISIIKSFASKMNAEVACSMPVADDLSWFPKECYIGRSGQQISPRVYFAVGISGAPQHLEGVRGAKIVVAINNDPEARIFKSADYGIVGDLYEIIPALEKVLA